jgi:hypothetical protein
MPSRVTFIRRPCDNPYAVHAPKISAHRTHRLVDGSRTGSVSGKCGRKGAAALLVIDRDGIPCQNQSGARWQIAAFDRGENQEVRGVSFRP